MMTTYEELQKVYYNQLCAGLDKIGLTRDGLKLNEPALPLVEGDDADEELWRFFNDLPTSTQSILYTQSGGNQLFNDYKGLMSALIGKSSTDPEGINSEKLACWRQYANENFLSVSPSSLPAVFLEWAKNSAPELTATGERAELEFLDDEIINAQLGLLQYGNRPPTWNKGYSSVVSELAHGIPLEIEISGASFVSGSRNSITSKSVFDQNTDKVAKKPGDLLLNHIADGNISVRANFKRVICFEPLPTDWFSLPAMKGAWANKTSPPWSPNSPINWSNTFGVVVAIWPELRRA